MPTITLLGSNSKITNTTTNRTSAMFQLLFSYFSLLFFSFLCFSRPSFPARTTPDTTAVSMADAPNATTWLDFARFLEAGVGSEVSGMSELKKYFHRFGYLLVLDAGNLTDTFDINFESAVVAYQKNFGLAVTGKIDSDTVSLIMSPRCGVSDVSSHLTARFAYFSGRPRWNRESPVMLTYAFSSNDMIDYISLDDIKAVFKRAFSRWSEVIPVSFIETEDYLSADVKIGFYHHDHGDGQPFDGILGILGHAFSPDSGRLHLDAAETWAIDFGTVKSKVAVDLESVATHEIGHVLGLAHSSVKEAVMYPSLNPRTKKVDLKIDDVEGIQALYGSNPQFNLNSLIENENVSNMGIGLKSRKSHGTLSLVVAVYLVLVLGSWQLQLL